MKLISLNTWANELHKPLVSFVQKHADTTDIFCFQEMSHGATIRHEQTLKSRPDFFSELIELLPDHEGLIAVFQEDWHWRHQPGAGIGNAIFIKKNQEVHDHGEFYIHGKKNGLNFGEAAQHNWLTMPRVLQFIQTTDQTGNPLTVFNYHGIWHLSGKGDIPERLEQSQKILTFMKKSPGKQILCGDFNLDLETKSVALLEENLRNLIREKGIITTRHPEYYPKYNEMPFADYTFVTNDVLVRKFEVPQEPVSDHLPMILEFE